MAAKKQKEFDVAMAIDFGTSYSGYAYSFKESKNVIIVNQPWVSGTSKLISSKTPTCVLLDPNKNFSAFGYEAENKFAELCGENEDRGWYMFQNFKMELFDNKELSVNTHIKDIQGKELPALTVFTHAISFLRRHFLQAVRNQRPDVVESDVQYVLTVPAIWNDKAKQFMRRAAVEAGIPDHQLKIALEPEVASIWCTECFKQELSKAGTKYIIADLGGGTADFAAHKRKKDGTLEELHMATGGPWGGTQVDGAYMGFISRFVGEKNITTLQAKYMEEFFDLYRDFEVQKRGFSGEKETCESFCLPSVLFAMVGGDAKVEKKISASKYKSSVTLRRQKLQVKPTEVQTFFMNPGTAIKNHLEEMFERPELRGINRVILVGGFSGSKVIKDFLRHAFPEKRFLIPADPDTAVLKGAVLFGHSEKKISERRSKYLYGISCSRPFDRTQHSEEKKRTENGRDQCRDIFEKMVDFNEPLRRGTKKVTSLTPAYASQTTATVDIYVSENREAYYVTDRGCHRLGSLTVRLPDAKTLQEKEACVTLKFDTELKCKVKIRKTGEKYETTIDCL